MCINFFIKEKNITKIDDFLNLYYSIVIVMNHDDCIDMLLVNCEDWLTDWLIKEEQSRLNQEDLKRFTRLWICEVEVTSNG